MDFASKYAYVNAAEDDDEDAVVEEDELEESSLATNIMLSKGQSNNNNNNDILDQLAPQNDELQADIAPQAPPAPSSSSSRVSGFLSGLFSRASAPPAPPVPKKEKDKKKDESKQQQSKRRFHRQADTNVVSLKFGSLADNADDLFAGDACHCANQNCRAVLSSTSVIAKRKKKASGVDQKDDDDSKAENFTSVKVVQEDAPKNAPAPEAMRIEIEEVDADEEEMVWKCEFCANENVVDLAPEEIPKTESRDYVIEPAPEDEKVDDDGAELVIFVIDISGSMGVTTEVPGVFKLRGKPITRDTGFDIPAEDGFVNAPVQRSRNTTWVSRLQCVQAAVDQQIETWKKNNPTKKVAIVTFNREVTILGDGSSDPEIVAGDKLQNQEQLQEIGKKHGVIKPLAETGSKLSDKLFVLEETGPTALGPALLVAVSMASVAKGSRVIVCTDGLANVGLGALDKTSCPTEQLRQQAEQWYEGVGQMAKLSGASVSVISIKGDECSLEDLGRVAEITGGDVTRVDPLELQKNFATMLEKPIVATQVSATFLLHKGLKFRNENEETNRVTREVGNVTDDTEIIFEYSLRSKDALQAYPDLKALPFQVQIHFTKRNGMRCMRVLSKEQPITADKQQAAESARMDLLAANVAQLSAKLAEVGDYEEARVANVSYGRFMAKNARNDEQRHAVSSWLTESEEYHGALHRQQAKMKAPSSDRAGGSASPMLSMAPMALGAPSAAPSSRSAAKSVRSDEDFEMNHRFKSKSSKAYSRK